MDIEAFHQSIIEGTKERPLELALRGLCNYNQHAPSTPAPSLANWDVWNGAKRSPVDTTPLAMAWMPWNPGDGLALESSERPPKRVC